jgi:hypothetical protein
MRKKNKIVHFFHLLLGLLFVLVAALQYNDPDPLVWGTFYLVAAIGAAVWAVRRPIPAIAWICIGASVVFLLQALTGVITNLQHPEGLAIGTMSSDRPDIEETREFGGAAIVLIWALLALLVPPQRSAVQISSSSEK